MHLNTVLAVAQHFHNSTGAVPARRLRALLILHQYDVANTQGLKTAFVNVLPMQPRMTTFSKFPQLTPLGPNEVGSRELVRQLSSEEDLCW